jgi:hypothetical protein
MWQSLRSKKDLAKEIDVAIDQILYLKNTYLGGIKYMRALTYILSIMDQ